MKLRSQFMDAMFLGLVGKGCPQVIGGFVVKEVKFWMGPGVSPYDM